MSAQPLQIVPKATTKPKVAKPVKKTLPSVKVSAAERRTIGQFIAAIAAGFLPVASYVIAHMEVEASPWKWVLVLAGLIFSAPTLAEWSQSWCGNFWKAWGFTVLLEGVMVFASTPGLAPSCLVILAAINCNSAWNLAGKAMKGKKS